MRRIILTAAAAFIVGGISTGAVLSQAQPAPPQQVDGTPPAGHGPAAWDHRPDQNGPHPWMHRLHALRTFGLIYRQPDRQLTPADVQKIAEGFLLWNGNHSWKVTDVAPVSDGAVAFSLSTPEGSTVAKFTMDPHSGKITRVG